IPRSPPTCIWRPGISNWCWLPCWTTPAAAADRSPSPPTTWARAAIPTPGATTTAGGGTCRWRRRPTCSSLWPPPWPASSLPEPPAAAAYAAPHYDPLEGWADYLVATTLDPEYQNQTDDFTGFIAHSSNLALKGIVALGAMARIAEVAGRPDQAARFRSTAER